jgi:hypothetical protein
VSLIEIFEDEEVTTDEKNKATRDLHDLGIPVYGRPKATLHAEELVKLCFGEVDNVMVCKQKPTSVRTNAVFVVDLQGVLYHCKSTSFSGFGCDSRNDSLECYPFR